VRSVVVCLLAGSALFAARPDVNDILRRSVANTQADWNAAPRYDFIERDVIAGNESTVKTYRVVMIDGSPYNEPLSANEAGNLQREIARRNRETPDERRRRVARYVRERRQDNELLQEMIKAIDFKLVGEEIADGRRCFVLEGTPKTDYHPTNRDTKVLKGMRGKMWIDEQTYQWVKVEAEVFRPVAFGLFIAHVEPGTKFTLEQKPVSENVWLPSHFSMRIKANVLRIWSRYSSRDETYSEYSAARQTGSEARQSE